MVSTNNFSICILLIGNMASLIRGGLLDFQTSNIDSNDLHRNRGNIHSPESLYSAVGAVKPTNNLQPYIGMKPGNGLMDLSNIFGIQTQANDINKGNGAFDRYNEKFSSKNKNTLQDQMLEAQKLLERLKELNRLKEEKRLQNEAQTQSTQFEIAQNNVDNEKEVNTATNTEAIIQTVMNQITKDNKTSTEDKENKTSTENIDKSGSDRGNVTLKSLTKRFFYFQVLPVVPENEVHLYNMTVYYID